MKDFSNPKTIKPLDTSRHDPLPFPGVCPTRWLIKMMWDPRPLSVVTRRGSASIRHTRSFVYNGKPSPNIARKVLSILNSRASRFWIFEYDRGGVIACTALPAHGPVNNLNVHNWNSAIYKFYYPWNTGTYFIAPWASQIYNRVRLTFRNKKFVVYSSVSAAGLAGSMKLQEHKTWLERENMKLGK